MPPLQRPLIPPLSICSGISCAVSWLSSFRTVHARSGDLGDVWGWGKAGASPGSERGKTLHPRWPGMRDEQGEKLNLHPTPEKKARKRGKRAKEVL